MTGAAPSPASLKAFVPMKVPGFEPRCCKGCLGDGAKVGTLPKMLSEDVHPISRIRPAVVSAGTRVAWRPGGLAKGTESRASCIL